MHIRRFRFVAPLLFLLVLLTGPSAGGSVPGETIPPEREFLYVSPVPGSDRVSPVNTIVLRPRQGDAAARLAGLKADVRGTIGGEVPGTWTLSSDGTSLIFTPARPYRPGEWVEVRMESREGSGESAVAFRFRVGGMPRAPESAEPGSLCERTAPREDLARPHREPAATAPGPAATSSAGCDSLPATYPSITVTHSNFENPGAVFVTPSVFAEGDGRLLILDERGLPLFYRHRPARTFDLKLQPNGMLSYFETDKFFLMDSTYAVVDSFATGNGYRTDGHDFQLLPDGRALLMAYDVQIIPLDTLVVGGRPDARVIGLIIQELDAAKNVVFQWRSWDHFDLLDGTVSPVVDYTAIQVDYVHANALEYDADGNILLCSRHMNEITKIDRQTGDILWRFGLHALNNEFTFVNDPRGFSHPHDIRRLDNGNVTLFDNGNFLSPEYSRALEYALDESTKTATLVWEHDADANIFGPFMGNAQRLPDGGTMIGWGGSPAIKLTDLRANGTKAFEMIMDPGMFTYRAFRFPWRTTQFTADTDTLDFGPVTVGNTVSLPLTITNNADSTIVLDCFLTTSAPFSVAQAPPVTVAAGDTAVIDVLYSPQVATGEGGELHIRRVEASELVTQVVGLKGNGGLQVGIPDRGGRPFAHRVFAVHPNPSGGRLEFGFELAHRDAASVSVYDASGRRIRQLQRGELPEGEHRVVWDGRDDRGRDVGSGVYFIRLETPSGSESRRIVRIR